MGENIDIIKIDKLMMLGDVQDFKGENTTRSHQMKIDVPIDEDLNNDIKESTMPWSLRKGDKYNNFIKRDVSLNDSMSSHYFDSDRVETEVLSQGISPTMRPPKLDKYEDCSDSDEKFDLDM